MIALLRLPKRHQLGLLRDERTVRKVDPLVRIGTQRLQDLLLVAEVVEALAKRGTRVLKTLLGTLDGRRRRMLLRNHVQVLRARLAESLVHIANLLAELRNHLHVGIAVVIELVGDDAIEALALPLKLVQERGVHRRREEEAVEHILRLRLRILDDRADLDLLLSLQELDLPHLVEVHADRILDHLRLLRLRVGRRRVLRLKVLLDVVLADDLHPERLEDLQILVGLDRIHDVGRQDLVEFLVGDVAAVRLAAALHVLDDVIELRLAQNRHPLHRRQDRVCIGRVSRFTLRSRRKRRLRGIFIRRLGGLGLRPLDLRRQRFRIQRGRSRLIDILRRKIVTLLKLAAAMTNRLLDL